MSTPMPVAVLPDLKAATHRPSALHAPGLGWVEKNCYVDLWIELLQARGLEPRACLAFLPALDFEGDQWTFFKPPLADLRRLYGIEVQELNLWRPLLDHAVEHLGAGKWLAVEVDAHWLPDTAGTDYRTAHAKTTVVFNRLDVAGRRLGYFHNAGYFELSADDFDGLFGLDPMPTGVQLPPYAELIRLDRARALEAGELRRRSAELLREHLDWRPRSNPVRRFAERFADDLPALQRAGLAHYHRWAFAGLRQLGAGFELAAEHLRWLDGETGSDPPPGCGGDDAGGDDAARHFARLSALARALMLKAARAVHSGRPLDASAVLGEMADAWECGMAGLLARRAGRVAIAA